MHFLVLINMYITMHGLENIKWQVLLEYRVGSIYIQMCNVTKKAFSSLETIVVQEWIISQLFMDYVFTPKHVCPSLVPDENTTKSRILLFQYLF
jgi:hypothetical protein